MGIEKETLFHTAERTVPSLLFSAIADKGGKPMANRDDWFNIRSTLKWMAAPMYTGAFNGRAGARAFPPPLLHQGAPGAVRQYDDKAITANMSACWPVGRTSGSRRKFLQTGADRPQDFTGVRRWWTCRSARDGESAAIQRINLGSRGSRHRPLGDGGPVWHAGCPGIQHERV